MKHAMALRSEEIISIQQIASRTFLLQSGISAEIEGNSAVAMLNIVKKRLQVI